MEEIVKEKLRNDRQKRMEPYLVKIGDTYSLVADGKVFVQVIGDSFAALLLLLSTFFVFNIEYCHKVRPTYLFLESVLLDRESEAGRNMKCQEVLAELHQEARKNKENDESLGNRIGETADEERNESEDNEESGKEMDIGEEGEGEETSEEEDY